MRLSKLHTDSKTINLFVFLNKKTTLSFKELQTYLIRAYMEGQQDFINGEIYAEKLENGNFIFKFPELKKQIREGNYDKN